MKILFILTLPLFIFAQNHGLKTFIEHANKTNDLIKAKEINVRSKQQEIEAAKSAYWPTVDIGASYTLNSPNYLASPGGVANAYVSANMSLYDGGKKEALVRSKIFERKASLFEKSAFKKSVILKIVRYYFSIQTLKATLYALEKRSKELKAQINRIRQFQSTGLATQEDVDKLQAAFEGNQYTIANTKLALDTSEENLKLVSGISAKHLKENHFKEPRHIHFKPFDSIKVMQANASAIGENAKAIGTAYAPQVTLSDTYHQSHFNDLATSPGASSGGFLIDHQNKLSVSVTMRVFDHGKISKEREAVKYEKMALLLQMSHAKKEQLMHFKLAKKSLYASKTKIKSAKSALKAAKSTYVVVKQKFEAGLVDNVTFLDALSQKTLAVARYKQTLYDYEVAKSIYYYYAGKNPKEFIQ